MLLLACIDSYVIKNFRQKLKDKAKTSKNKKVLEPLHFPSSKRFDLGCIESFEDGVRSCFPGLPLEFSFSCRSSNSSDRRF